MKKLINIPDRVVEDMIQGYCLAHPDVYKRVGDRSLVRMEVEEGKVGIVIGGGSGHEPAFLGYVGQGLADGVAIGNIFASPSPEPTATSLTLYMALSEPLRAEHLRALASQNILPFPER